MKKHQRNTLKDIVNRATLRTKGIVCYYCNKELTNGNMYIEDTDAFLSQCTECNTFYTMAPKYVNNVQVPDEFIIRSISITIADNIFLDYYLEFGQCIISDAFKDQPILTFTDNSIMRLSLPQLKKKINNLLAFI